MKDLPAREKLDLAEMVAQYLVLAGTLDKTSPLEDYDRANARPVDAQAKSAADKFAREQAREDFRTRTRSER